jgi:hypothetical protein
MGRGGVLLPNGCEGLFLNLLFFCVHYTEASLIGLAFPYRYTLRTNRDRYEYFKVTYV